MNAGSYRIRKASPNDRDAVMAMQERSIRALGRSYYTAEAIESALRHIGTMDPHVIDEGSYYIAVTPDGRIVGSGGLSYRMPGYENHAPGATAKLDKPNGFAFIRGVYVDPDWARKGIASAIMTLAEADAAQDSIPALSLVATLSGVPLYRALQYRALQPKQLRFPDGVQFEGLEMMKQVCSRAR
jgi:predicted N-acetyltransferase YhbS